MKAPGLRDRFEACQRRQQELQNARAWGGVDEAQERQLDEEWERLSRLHEFQAYMEAQQELIEVCTEMVSRITDGIGLDFARACATGGCC